MKPVIQLEPTGCAIASVAAIADVSYGKVRSAAANLGILARDERLWSDSAHMRRLLQRFDVCVGHMEIPFRSWEDLPPIALLAIKWHLEKHRPFWHWVVFVRDQRGARVLDSKKSLRRHSRTDFGRIKPKWFIAIDHSKPRSTGRNDHSQT
ncbi:MAG TPA: hypothetical protein VGA27_09100 [Candidatus Binatia bacterium]